METRRDFLMTGAGAAIAATMSSEALAQPLPPKSPMGIASAAMGMHSDGLGVAKPLRGDSLAYVEYCRSLGAGGLQFSPTGDLKRVRRRMEQLGMFFEGNARLPAKLTDDTAEFVKSLQECKDMGGTIVRSVSRAPQGTSGRRYEGFKSVADFDAWQKEANAIVLKVLPIAEKMRVKLALENHKDRMVDDHAAFLKATSSEYLGSLIDPGNNISFMEQPEETVSKLAPYVLACSLKDMGVAPYEDGFLLSEMPIGEGGTDQKALWDIMKKANPKLNPIEEIITRDPLKVPIFLPSYSAAFPPRPASDLAKHFAWVKSKAQKLPYVSQLSPAEQLAAEESNHRKTLDWARANIA